MGSIPADCGEEFEVSSSGKSKEEAKENAQTKANALCKRLNKGCNIADENPDGGSYRESDHEFTYTSKYVCIGL